MTTETDFTTATPAALSPTTHADTPQRVVGVRPVADSAGAWDITFEDGQSVQTRWLPFVRFAEEAQRRGVRVEFETDPDDGFTLQSFQALESAQPPRPPRISIACARQLADVIEEMAQLLQRAAWHQAGMTTPMPAFSALSPQVRGTFRQAATVAVRKLCVQHMVIAQSQVAPLFPGVNVRDVVQLFDQAIAQEWI
jgi:hypothetical protein